MRPGYNKFKGTGVAIVTPFLDSEAIDFDSYARIIDHVIDGGADFIVALGTTGESATMSKPERKALIDFSVKKIKKRVPLMVGIGGNCTTEVVLAIHSMPLKGVDGILSVCPYYNKPQQEGIFIHFKTIAEASPVPVILYTVPGRTSSNIAAATTLRLANECLNIIGIKEASGNFDQIYQVLKNRPDDFLVLSGDDGITLPLISAGADGVISVVANAFPREFSDMVRACLNNDYPKARENHFLLIDFINALFMDGSPAGIKAALEIMGLCKNELRLPLVGVRNEVYQHLQQLISQIKK